MSKAKTPRPGETRRGHEIGKDASHTFRWLGCQVCGLFRWVQVSRGKPQNKLCRPCARKRFGAALEARKTP